MSDSTAEQRLALERQQRASQLQRSGQWRMILGGALTLTLVGAIIGIPLGVSGIQKLRKAKRVKRGAAV